MDQSVTYFFELMQVALGKRAAMSAGLDDEQWREVCTIAGKQNMLGLAFRGLDLLPKEQCPSKRPMMWMYDRAAKIKRHNQRNNSAIPIVFEHFGKMGYRCVLLKGQSMAALYDDPFSRTPGDLDIWLDGRKSDVIASVRADNPGAKVCYHHIDCGKIEGIEVEAHFTPSWMFSPSKNRIFQKWANAEFPKALSNSVSIDGVSVCTPNLDFNRLFILVHIYRHLFSEGVGLRQLMDYYFVLAHGFTDEGKRETLRMIDSLGLRKFTAAVMFVLQKVFLLDDECLLVEPSAEEGEFLLEEVMKAGNLGQYDEDNHHIKNEGELHIFFRKMLRLRRFIVKYPEEVLWSPVFKIWQFFWRKTR